MKNPEEIEKFCQFLDLLAMRLKSNTSSDTQTFLGQTSNLSQDFSVSTHDYEILAKECYKLKMIDDHTTKIMSLFLSSTTPTTFTSTTMAKITNVTMVSSIQLFLIHYLYPIILVIGIFGNLVSFVAMLRKSNIECQYQNNNLLFTKRKRRSFNCKQPIHTFSFCLAILCLADFFILVFGCLQEYVEIVYDVSLRSTYLFACKTIYFLCYLFSSYISYLHAYVALDRWFAIVKPMEYKRLQLMRNNKYELLIIFLICFVICLPFFYFPTLVDTSAHFVSMVKLAG